MPRSRRLRFMARPSRPPLTSSQAGWLLASGTAAALPLAPHVPPWLTAAAVLTFGWRAWLAWQRQPLPARWVLILLAIAGSAGVLLQFHTLFGQNAGVALLMLFMALKQMEARSSRDGLAIIFLAYFLALAQFFYSQTIPAALATAAGTVVATAALANLTDPRNNPPTQLRLATQMLVQAMPLMLLLFVLFPRVQGPLWGLPSDAHAGLTGLSDSMAPGSISQLSQSDAIAFRVRFADTVPAHQQLYWRGPVLSEFDGRAWRPAQITPRPKLPYDEPNAGGIDYEVTLEPHGKGWLFALELAGHVPSDALATRDFLLLAKTPVTTRIRYPMRSFPGLPTGQDEPESVRLRALSLPAGSNPRLRSLAAEWHRQATSDEDVLRLAKDFFFRQRLVYTLTPPLLGDQSADEFLFDTKEGFCEHFANAFAIAMRAAGIPARVVTGYQGGEMNPVDGYLTVRQYDAHAWTEVWLANRGWVRVDPTAISAPTRIDLNLAAAVPVGDPLPLLMRADLSWLRDLRHRVDAVTNAWNQWVLGYNPDRQRELLRRLGMQSPDWQRMTAALATLSGLAMLALTAWNLRSRVRLDPAARLWARVSRRLGRHGLARRPQEGPRDYAKRVGASLPHTADSIDAIATVYAHLRYGRGSAHELSQLRRLVASFNP
jgi:transglutaminase-like putative cysteine protease